MALNSHTKRSTRQPVREEGAARELQHFDLRGQKASGRVSKEQDDGVNTDIGSGLANLAILPH